jgi:hypothetical protein
LSGAQLVKSTMSIGNLNKMYHPRPIAIIGAAEICRRCTDDKSPALKGQRI